MTTAHMSATVCETTVILALVWTNWTLHFRRLTIANTHTHTLRDKRDKLIRFWDQKVKGQRHESRLDSIWRKWHRRLAIEFRLVFLSCFSGPNVRGCSTTPPHQTYITCCVLSSSWKLTQTFHLSILQIVRIKKSRFWQNVRPVSYTHLTLPTIYSV